ncbi:MAG: hypothetical protein RLZ22_891 [Verrucomicrobiota bacterium]|jgi:hypothetical protein
MTGEGSEGFSDGVEVAALSSLSSGIVSMSGNRNPSSGIIDFDGSAASGTMVATGAVSAAWVDSTGGLLGSASGAEVFDLKNEHAGKQTRQMAIMPCLKIFLSAKLVRIDCHQQSRLRLVVQGRSEIA